MLNASDVVALVRDEMLKAFSNEANQLDIIDRWARWDHDKPHAPRVSTTEYKQLADRSHTPWLMVPVNAVAQQLYVEDHREGKLPDNDEG